MSTDTGATWTSVSNAAMNNIAPYSNVRIATEAGAVDCLNKDDELDAIVAAIHRAAGLTAAG